MAHYHANLESRHSAADTFGYLATFSNTAQWDPGVLAARQLDPGPVGTGTRFRLIVPFLGRRLPLTYEVTRYVMGREVVLAATSGILRATDRIGVTDGADGVQVSYAAEVTLRGPLRVLDPLLGAGFRVVAGRAATGLARALSADHAPLTGHVSPAGPAPSSQAAP